VGAQDPRALAAAWLAKIPVDQRAAAAAVTDTRLFTWLAAGAVLIGLCVIVTRANAIGRLRQVLESTAPRPWLVSGAAGLVLVGVLAWARAVVDAVSAWRVERIVAAVGWATPRSLASHLAGSLTAIGPAVMWGFVLVPLLLWLMRRQPRSWPLWTGGAFTAGCLTLIWLPYALSLGPATSPAPNTPTVAGVSRLIAQIGLPTRTVWLSPDPAFDADVSGAFGQAKVTLGPELAAGPPAEARAYVGHLASHYLHGDLLVVCLIWSAAALAGCVAVQRWAPPLARTLGARGVASSADVEALPAAAIIALCVFAASQLAGAGYLRWANVRADAYSLDHAREPDGLAAVLERTWDHQAVDPGPLAKALFYTHPPLKSRLEQAAAWKAAHGG
jgi:STE24 endopeptidase